MSKRPDPPTNDDPPPPPPTQEDGRSSSLQEVEDEEEVIVSKQEFSIIDVGQEPNELAGATSLRRHSGSAGTTAATTTTTASQIRPDPIAPTAQKIFLEAKRKAQHRKSKAKALGRRTRVNEMEQGLPPTATIRNRGRKQFPTEKFRPHHSQIPASSSSTTSQSAAPEPDQGHAPQDHNNENDDESSTNEEDDPAHDQAINTLLVEASLITNQPNQISNTTINTAAGVNPNSQQPNNSHGGDDDNIPQAEIIVVSPGDRRETLSSGLTDSMEDNKKCLDINERGFKLAILGMITIIILAVIIVIGVVLAAGPTTSNNNNDNNNESGDGGNLEIQGASLPNNNNNNNFNVVTFAPSSLRGRPENNNVPELPIQMEQTHPSQPPSTIATTTMAPILTQQEATGPPSLQATVGTTPPSQNPTSNTLITTMHPTPLGPTNALNPSPLPSMPPPTKQDPVTTNPPTSTRPSNQPTPTPSTLNPTHLPTVAPTTKPSPNPTTTPSLLPSHYPTLLPTVNPTRKPTPDPTTKPTLIPTHHPTSLPTETEKEERLTMVFEQTINGEAEDGNFGYYLEFSGNGNNLAIGSPDANYVQVFRFNNNNNNNGEEGFWSRVGQTISWDGGGTFGYRLDLNHHGTVLVVGIPRYDLDRSGEEFGTTDTQQRDAGLVKVFEYDDSSNKWKSRGQEIKGAGREAYFGWDVSISDDGNTIACAARTGNLNGKEESGYVQVFSYDSDSTKIWTQLGESLVGEETLDQFGRSLSMNGSGQRIAVGAHHAAGDRGRVYIFDLVDGSWNLVGTPIEGDGRETWHGTSVDLSTDGNIVAIGADGDNSNTGVVKVYEQDGCCTWSQRGSSITGESMEDKLGTAQVSLSSDGRLLGVGAHGFRSDTGKAYLFLYSSYEDWELVGEVTGKNMGDKFGFGKAVAGDGSHFAVGGYQSDGKEGYVRVYSVQSN